MSAASIIALGVFVLCLALVGTAVVIGLRWRGAPDIEAVVVAKQVPYVNPDKDRSLPGKQRVKARKAARR